MQGRARRSSSGGVALLLLCATFGEVAVGHAAEPSSGASREEILETIGVVDQELGAAERRLDKAQRDLDRIAGLAGQAAQDLAIVTAQLAVAEAAAGEAGLAALEQMDLAVGSGAVQAHQAALDRAAAELADRAVWVWKHGPGADLGVRLQLVGGAQSSHDLAVSNRVVEDMVASSTNDTRKANLHLAQLLAARSVSTRDEARRTAFRARSELSDIKMLAQRQRILTRQLEELRLEQRAIVEGLRGDRDATAALVRELRETLVRVSLQGALVAAQDLPLDGPPPAWTDLLPTAGRNWAAAINAVAVRNGVDGALLAALVWSESGFHAAAVSPMGAVGLTQLLPTTAAGMGIDPWDPLANLAGGARYLRAQIERFGGVDVALAAYNAGPGRVSRAGNAIPALIETQLYVVRVLERWERLRGAA